MISDQRGEGLPRPFAAGFSCFQTGTVSRSGSVNVVKTITALVAHPPLVDVRILARLEAVDVVLVLLDVDRAAGRAAGADAVAWSS